jgi:hypothetical protein
MSSTTTGEEPMSSTTLIARALEIGTVIARAPLLAGLPLIATGIGLTMVGIFAVIGIPMLILGLALVSAAAGPDRERLVARNRAGAPQ